MSSALKTHPLKTIVKEDKTEQKLAVESWTLKLKRLEGRAKLIRRHQNAVETMHEVNVRREAKIKRQLQKPEMRITIDTAQKACGEPSNLIWNVVGSGARKVSAEVEEGRRRLAEVLDELAGNESEQDASTSGP